MSGALEQRSVRSGFWSDWDRGPIRTHINDAIFADLPICVRGDRGDGRGEGGGDRVVRSTTAETPERRYIL